MPAPVTGVTGPRRIMRRVAWLTLFGAAVAGVVVMLLVVQGDHRKMATQHSEWRLLVADRSSILRDTASVTARLREAERQDKALHRSLHHTNATLDETSSVLDAARADSAARGIDIVNLNVCLGGVQAALNQLSVGDDSGALASLSVVSNNCAHAGPAS